MSVSPPRRVALAASGAAWEPVVVQALDGAERLELSRRCVDVAELIAHAQTGGTDVALVDASLPGLDVAAVHAVRAAGVQLVGLGDAARADELGIETTAAPEAAVATVHALEPLVRAAADPVSDSAGGRGHGRLVTVWGPTGAPGRSVVAAALADATARAGRSSLLLDADVHGGTQAQALGLLDEVSGLLAACRAANHGRREDVLGAVQRLGVTPLSVLTGLPRADLWVHVRSGPLERVLDVLLEHHELVVADLGFSVETAPGPAGGRHEATRRLLERADTVLAVGRADPTGLVRLVRGLGELAEAGIERPVVVLNQVRPAIGWSVPELTATLERLAGVAPAAHLPSDPATLDHAALRGALPAAVDARSPFVRAVDALAARLVPDPTPRPR